MSYYQHPLDATGLPSWKALEEHRLTMQNFSMREAFKADPTRFDDLSVSCCGLFLDYSKNLITPETRTLLVNLAREAGVEQRLAPCSKASESTAQRIVRSCTPRCDAPWANR